MGHMQEFMYYMGRCFENAGKAEKLIRKANTPEKYLDAVARLFTEREVVILATTAAQVNFWARTIQALGIPPAGFCTVPPAA